MKLENILTLSPEYRDYIWGGKRLRPSGERTAEAWIVFENNYVQNGMHAGKTLGQLSSESGEKLLGQLPYHLTGSRFPLLIKLLDCAQWLSLQVHPNDEQARQLEGPQHNGKTEAWHIIEARQNAELIAGLRPDVKSDQIIMAMRNGNILDWVQFHSVRAGDSVFMPAGTIHALGPGLLLYEVQQTSDITYRVYDWDRPETPERPLHIDKSLAVIDSTTATRVSPLEINPDNCKQTLVSCPYFTLEYLHGAESNMDMDTKQQSFHALTVIEGQAAICTGEETTYLNRFESALITGYTGKYSIQPRGNCTLLKSSVEAR